MRQRPLAQTIGHAFPSQQAGFSLLGIILVAAVSSAVLAVAYTAYNRDRSSSRVAEAAQTSASIGQRVRTAYASASDFSALSSASALHEGLYPASTLGQDGQPVNPWGGSIQLAGIPKNFVLTYEGVAANDCPQLAIAAGTGWQDVKVNGTSVMTGSIVSPSAAAALCDQSPTAGASVQFVGTRNAGMLAPALNPCAPQPPQSQQVACPLGQISSVPPYSTDGITQQRTSFCNMAYGPVGWSPWSPVSNTCAPACTPPPAKTETQASTGMCPAGQATTSGATSFPQTSTRTVTYSCPAPTGAYVATAGAWSAATPTASSACAPVCVAPAPVSTPQTQTANCPTGQKTSSGSSSFTQTRTVVTTYSCPAPTGGYTSSSTNPAWSPAASSVCAATPTCPAGDQYIGSTGTMTPVQIQGGPYGAMSTYNNVDNFNLNMLAQHGVAAGSYTVKISYLGQSTTVTVTCKSPAGSNDYCSALYDPNASKTVNLAGGTFSVGVTAWIPIGGSGPMGAKGTATIITKAPGC